MARKRLYSTTIKNSDNAHSQLATASSHRGGTSESARTSHDASHPHSFLTTFPTEIRNRIYGYCLYDTEPTLIRAISINRHRKLVRYYMPTPRPPTRRTRAAICDPHLSSWTPPKATPLAPALLATCRQIQHEAAGYLYPHGRRMVFEDFGVLREWMGMIGENLRFLDQNAEIVELGSLTGTHPYMPEAWVYDPSLSVAG